jgi:pyridoxine 5-phosphate synthase
VRRLVLALDSLPSLREANASPVDVAAAATLGELAAVDGVRLGVNEELLPVREADVQDARRAARTFELRMPPAQTLLKVALEARPDRVLLAGRGRDGRAPSGPLDLSGRGAPLGPILRALGEAGIPVGALVEPVLGAVKAAHGEGFRIVELFTGAIVDLPADERRAELETLGDAVRLASKLNIDIGVGGGLGYRTVREVLDAAPAAESVVIGRAALTRGVLVGLDRALRDLRALVDATASR